VFQPLTGANAAGGELELKGTVMAHELQPTVVINGVTHRVELIVADNRSDPVEAANIAQRFVDHDRVHIVLGSWGSAFSMAAGEVFKGRVPAIALSATNPLVTLGNDWYFRVCFIDPFQGHVMANYSYNDLNARTAVIVREIGNPYSVGLSTFFDQSFQRLGGRILSTIDFNTGDQDFSAQLTTIRSQNPDVVFAPGGDFTSVALLIRQARDLGIGVQFLGGDTWETRPFLDGGGDRVEGARFSTKFAVEFAASPEAQTFMREYHRRNNNQDPATVTALGYDGYLVALDAMRRAGSLDPDALRRALVTTNVEGATGLTTFDENGDANKPAFIKEVRGGRFVYLTYVNP
jgi:branched-chain amino acid transport system substrate-binding protein